MWCTTLTPEEEGTSRGGSGKFVIFLVLTSWGEKSFYFHRSALSMKNDQKSVKYVNLHSIKLILMLACWVANFQS